MLVFSILYHAASLVQSTVSLINTLIFKVIHFIVTLPLVVLQLLVFTVWYIVSTSVSTILSAISLVVTTLLSIPRLALSFAYNQFLLVTFITLCIPPALVYLLYRRYTSRRIPKMTNHNGKHIDSPRVSRATNTVQSYDNKPKLTWSQTWHKYEDSLTALGTLLVEGLYKPHWLVLAGKFLLWFANMVWTNPFWYPARLRNRSGNVEDIDLSPREYLLLQAIRFIVAEATWDEYRLLLRLLFGIEEYLYQPQSSRFRHREFKGHWYGPRDTMITKWDFTTPEADRSQPFNVVLYNHGGGFSVGGSPMYPSMFMDIATQCTRKTGVETRVFSVDYTLSNVAPVGKAIQETLAAYDYLRNELQIDASRIIVGGESAGGGLALCMAHKCRETKRPMPHALLLISPWINIDPTALDEQTAQHDYLTVKTIKECSSFYIGDRKHDDPECSPMYADQHGLPPTLINYGGREVFRKLILECGEKMQKQGVEVDYLSDPRLYHIYTCFAHLTRGNATKHVDQMTTWLSKQYTRQSQQNGNSTSSRSRVTN